nr:immunoglobulin light chain junction region [Macaca mulatta]MOW05684.1 immunoglobulin light chain junction region [Macaca mulatta]MOW06098.1 immunoglobulin light chain junction region [Macaca mulatta]MOW06917.1 immunoglobulin light chain junction region [Macaca mulatta]MOW06976.1 immunoglobulin light chain junction region [Macaca mulatta]
DYYCQSADSNGWLF